MQTLDDKLKNEIESLEKDINSLKSVIEAIEQKMINIKELMWERESKKESSKMYKVLENEKPSTIVRSNVGDIKVDREFMEKEIHKHLDNPALRGMITTEEMLSFPKVARNVGAEYNQRRKNYTWKVKANDENVLRYGSREYEKEGKDINRLLTSYSETEYGERQDRGEQGQLRREFNDRDFLRPADESIPQNDNKANDESILRYGSREYKNNESNNIPLTQAELQRRLDINLKNIERVSSNEQKQAFLERANAIKEQAKKQHIALDSKSLKTLAKANLIKSNTNTKER